MTCITLVSPIQTIGDDPYDNKARSFPAIGVYRLAAAVADSNIQMMVFDNPTPITRLEFSNLAQNIAKMCTKSNILGLSTTYTTIDNAIHVAHLARQKGFKGKIVIGGMGAYAPIFIDEINKALPDDTYLVIGFGELALRLLLNQDEVKDRIIISTLNKHNFNVFSVLAYRFVVEAVHMHWKYNEERLGDNSRFFRIITESHCPRGCRYCSSTHIPSKPLYLSADAIKSAVDIALDTNPTGIMFQGDNFLLGRKGKQRLQELIDTNFQSPVDLMLQTHPKDVLDVDPDHLIKIGTTAVSLGIESFSDEILSHFGKKIDADTCHSAISTLLDNNIGVFANIILTSPEATPNQVKHTLKCIKEYMKKGVKFGINLAPKLYPPSVMFIDAVVDKKYDEQQITYTNIRIKVGDVDISLKKPDMLLPQHDGLRKAVLRVRNMLTRSQTSENLSVQIIRLMERELEVIP